MSAIREIEKTVYLPPKYLDGKLKQHILEVLLSENTCSKEYGYITKIIDLTRVESIPIVNPIGYPAFLVNCQVETIMPVKNMILNCKITMIFPQGIFTEYGPMKTLISASSLINGRYENNSFVIDDKKYSIGDEISVKLTDIKYEKNAFHCIGQKA